MFIWPNRTWTGSFNAEQWAAAEAQWAEEDAKADKKTAKAPASPAEPAEPESASRKTVKAKE